MRIESLAYFLEIAQAGSFSLAARRLYVSQQGLSKAVKALERELDVVLFERAGKRIRLTEAGCALVPLAQACIEDHRKAKDAMRAFARRVDARGKPRVQAMPFVANGLFTLMKNELDARGLREVVLEERGLPGIVHALVRGARDDEGLAMVVLPRKMLHCLLRNPAVAFVPLFEASIVLVGTKELISPKRRSLAVREVAALPIVYFSEPILDGILADMFASCPFQNVVMHSSNVQMLDEYVANGRAVTFTDSFSAYLDDGSEELLFVPLRDAASFVVGFAYLKEDMDAHRLDYIARFKECIEEACGPYLAKHPLPACQAGSWTVP